MTLELLGIVVRLVAALAMGAVIGLERQWRARAAGLRTNALVALGSALFVVMGAVGFADVGAGSDPTRVAAQVVSGIGFLGAGVIMKQGSSVTGINTAATLWASAAVGALCGSGLLLVGLLGTVGVVLANMLLRPLGRRLDRHGGTVRPGESDGTEYTFEVHCRRDDEVFVRAIVFDAVHTDHFLVRSVGATDQPDDEVVITAVLDTCSRDDEKLEAAIAQVIKTPEVIGVRWSAERLGTAD